jgi:hypothetical protein
VAALAIGIGVAVSGCDYQTESMYGGPPEYSDAALRDAATHDAQAIGDSAATDAGTTDGHVVRTDAIAVMYGPPAPPHDAGDARSDVLQPTYPDGSVIPDVLADVPFEWDAMGAYAPPPPGESH